ncbi:calcium/sodium antiporter [Gammaproteobacteria bacterium]|nr:calcium/sodium antiporter [Gammaproteobacteria bacterium]MDA9045087.1 calcium/sodium antiporter [Gammaproteobacteria bacterium]MDA9196281.1 calcium/sodium antiporter [Gammaproteobacteria bacterium]MDB4591776.1 calcium/sodium antiporter [Gammaproteobacteria bacterium]
MNLIGLILSIVVLVWGADKFVDNAALIAKRLGLSELTIGLTIVALGTSAPEIFVGISSVLSGTEELALGTVIGSNISNIALIFGVSCIGLSAMPKKTPPIQFFAFLLSAIVLALAMLDLQISSYESISLLLVFSIFTYVTFKYRTGEQESDNNQVNPIQSKILFTSLVLLIGLIALILGSRYAVLNAKEIAIMMNVSQLVIGLTIIAIGTSLPELAATISAILKKKNDMVVGNVIGSNVLNITLVVPIIGFFSNVNLTESILSRDMLAMFIATILFIIVASLYSTKVFNVFISRVIGVIFVGGYLVYILLVSNIL